MSVIQVVNIPPIRLKWSAWTPWERLLVDARQGGANLPHEPGVYEVRYVDEEKRLTIGKASSLRFRVKQGMAKGQVHSTGERILQQADVSRIVVRWAVTERRAAAEEELHRLHIEEFGGLPTFTKHT